LTYSFCSKKIAFEILPQFLFGKGVLSNRAFILIIQSFLLKFIQQDLKKNSGIHFVFIQSNSERYEKNYTPNNSNPFTGIMQIK
jgi:hypothetical protein